MAKQALWDTMVHKGRQGELSSKGHNLFPVLEVRPEECKSCNRDNEVV